MMTALAGWHDGYLGTDMKLTLLAALLLATPAIAATPYEAGDIFRISQVENPQVSPDGRRVLFMRTYADIATDKRMGELWLLTVGGDKQLLIGGPAGAAGARWSPDSSRIAYIAPVAGKPQLHVMRLSEGIGRPVTSGNRAPGQFAWSPDGKSIAFAAQVDAKPVTFTGMPTKPEGATWAADARVVTDFQYRLNDGGYQAQGARHLFIIGADGGPPRQITKGDVAQISADSPVVWTPDGMSLVVAALIRPDADLKGRDSDLYVVSVDGSGSRQLTSSDGVEGEPAVSPDGKWVAYSGAPDKPAFYVRPDLWVVPITGGTPRNLTSALDREIHAPLWSTDGKFVRGLMNEAGVTRVIEVAVAGGVPRVVVKEVGGTRLYLPSAGGSFSTGGAITAYTSLFADRPAGLAVQRHGKLVTSIDFNADWRAAKSLGKLERLTWKSTADGRDIEGWVQYPPDFDPAKKYPLILDIHGGPNGDYGPMFSVTHQLYAANGYLVLFSNPRGSIGYGEQFANFYGHPYPSEDHDDLMSGVAAMVRQPFVDARNLFISGGSGGGVLTLWAIAKAPGQFRAAAALRPVTDWTVQALSSDIQSLTVGYWLGGANPWDGHDVYWKQSPLSLVGKVVTPTLLITGEADFRTPIAQTEAYYQALKLRGVPAMMVRLPEANHGMGRPSQWLTSNVAVIDWFNRYRVQ